MGVETLKYKLPKDGSGVAPGCGDKRGRRAVRAENLTGICDCDERRLSWG